jgi:predicted HAD superfamily phosphohydrolase YqeG
MASRFNIFCKALKNRELLQPKLYFKKFNEIDPSFLKQIGIRAIGIDKDNTITLPSVNKVYSQIDLSKLKKDFALAIFSNTYGSEKFDLPFLDEIPVIQHGTKKPLGKKSL